MSASVLRKELETVEHLWSLASKDTVSSCPESVAYPTSRNAESCRIARARAANLRKRLDDLARKAESLAERLRDRIGENVSEIEKQETKRDDLLSAAPDSIDLKLTGERQLADSSYFYTSTLVSGFLLMGILAGAVYTYLGKPVNANPSTRTPGQ